MSAVTNASVPLPSTSCMSRASATSPVAAFSTVNEPVSFWPATCRVTARPLTFTPGAIASTVVVPVFSASWNVPESVTPGTSSATSTDSLPAMPPGRIVKVPWPLLTRTTGRSGVPKLIETFANAMVSVVGVFSTEMSAASDWPPMLIFSPVALALKYGPAGSTRVCVSLPTTKVSSTATVRWLISSDTRATEAAGPWPR